MVTRVSEVFRCAAVSLPIAISLSTSSMAAETGELVASIASPQQVRAPATIARSTCGIASFDRRLLDLVNRLRSRGAQCGDLGAFAPAAPLGWSSRLSSSAGGHVLDMAANNFFGHVGRTDGRSVEHRLAEVGQNWGEYAENLAAGLSSVEEVVARWVASPAHCANLMNPNFTEVGAACAPAAPASRFRTYWTLDLAGP